MSNDRTAPTTVPAADEPFLRAQQVADRLDVHVSTVYRLADSGRLRAHRIGEGRLRKRGLRIPESAVAEFLRASLIDPTEEISS